MPPKRSSKSTGSDSVDRDSDDHQDEVGSQPDGDNHTQPGAAKPGRKRNPNTPAARRDQNRIAQREFRLRKQQKIRDLEARVELLSGSKEDTFVQLKGMLTELMHENHTLRQLVRDLSAFIGEGMGGFLPKLGWDMPSFQEFVSRAETDTAFEAFAARKKTTDPNPTTSILGQKRPADPLDAARRKKAKTPGAEELVGSSTGLSGLQFGPRPGTDSLYSSGRADPTLFAQPSFPSTTAPTFPSQSPFPPVTRGPDLSNGTSPTSRNSFSFGVPFGSNRLPSLSPVYGHRPPSSSTFTNSSPSGSGDFGTPPTLPFATSEPSPFPSASANSFLTEASTAAATAAIPAPAPAADRSLPIDPQDDENIDMTGKKGEATKLILYHLNNYKRSNAYCLPPSLRPTLVQRAIRHDGIIDGVIFPELRDRMILYQGQFDLAECIHLLYRTVTVHGDDVIAHANWEVDEVWFKRFPILVDPTMLSSTNRWRRERGEAPLLFADLAPAEPPTESANLERVE